MFGKRHLASLLAEFLGTGVLTVVILSVQRSQIGLPFFVAIAAGLALVLTTFAFGNNSGAHFNPAITLALWTARKISFLRAVPYIVVQMLGGWAALGIFTYFSNTHLSSVGGHYTGRILIAEAIGTGLFALVYAATVYKNLTLSSRSAFAGLAYALGVVSASTAALGLLNPAVALGIKAFTWAYVLGPIIGAVIGVNLYAYVFAEPEAAVVASSVVVPASATSASVKRPTKKSAAKKKTVKK